MMLKKILLSVIVLCTIPTITQGIKVEKGIDNPLAHITNNPGFCGIFHKWGFIGDSLCSGEHESHNANGTKGYNDIYDYSWGQRICAYTGTTGDNYSQAGETAHGWIEHFWNAPKNRNGNIDAETSPKQAYIMALGINDCNHSDKNPLGDVTTDIDTLNYDNNKNTFVGNYAGIIQRIRSIAPKSKFFLVTMPRSANNNGVDAKRTKYNEGIRAVAKLFKGVYLIDLEKYACSYGHDTEFHQKYFMGGHMNAMGYEYTAWMFMTYINWIIEHNWKDFEQAAYIDKNLKY